MHWPDLAHSVTGLSFTAMKHYNKADKHHCDAVIIHVSPTSRMRRFSVLPSPGILAVQMEGSYSKVASMKISGS